MTGPSFPAVGGKKALESLTGIDHLESEASEANREALDEEELREVEYESMGLHAPAHEPPSGLLARIRRWFSRN